MMEEEIENLKTTKDYYTKLVEIYSVPPLVNPASIEDIEEALKKCDNTSK